MAYLTDGRVGSISANVSWWRYRAEDQAVGGSWSAPRGLEDSVCTYFCSRELVYRVPAVLSTSDVASIGIGRLVSQPYPARPQTDATSLPFGGNCHSPTSIRRGIMHIGDRSYLTGEQKENNGASLDGSEGGGILLRWRPRPCCSPHLALPVSASTSTSISAHRVRGSRPSPRASALPPRLFTSLGRDQTCRLARV